MIAEPIWASADDDDGDGDGEGSNNGISVITRTQKKLKKPSLYRVLILNDDYTPMYRCNATLVMVLPSPKIGYRPVNCHRNGDLIVSNFGCRLGVRVRETGNRFMIDDVYNAKILEFAGNIPRIGVLDDADASARAHSKLCGSTVKIWLKLDGDIVSDFSHVGEQHIVGFGDRPSQCVLKHLALFELLQIQSRHHALPAACNLCNARQAGKR